MQVNTVTLIFQERFLRLREVKEMDKPLSYLVNMGLQGLKTYF